LLALLESRLRVVYEEIEIPKHDKGKPANRASPRDAVVLQQTAARS
jgi:hypothetical protein